jgi:hypothetical protein
MEATRRLPGGRGPDGPGMTRRALLPAARARRFPCTGGETPSMSASATTTRDQCRTCSRKLKRPSTGRPPTYCSLACRRSGEFAVRRIARRLETLEAARSEARIDAALGHLTEERAHAADAAYGAEIARLEDRLRQLLETQDDAADR